MFETLWYMITDWNVFHDIHTRHTIYHSDKAVSDGGLISDRNVMNVVQPGHTEETVCVISQRGYCAIQH